MRLLLNKWFYFFTLKREFKINEKMSFRSIGAAFGLPLLITTVIVTHDSFWKVSIGDTGYGPAMPVIFHSGLWEFCQSSSASTAGISTAGFCQAFATPITYMDDMAPGIELIVARFLLWVLF